MRNLKTIFSTLMLLAVFSCAKVQKDGESAGQVTFSLNSDVEIADQTKSSVSTYTTMPSAEEFKISITSAANAFTWSGMISEWDSATLVPAGTYTVTATYGSLEEEGFDKPFFTGTAEFTVVAEETTDVAVNVALGNTVVLVRCTDNFSNYYTDYTFKVVRDTDQIATFAKGETRGAFVDGYKITLEGTVTGPSKTLKFKKDYTALREATAYTFNFDASNVGGTAITISFNDTVETVELGDLELND
jgi:hypothetical protein